MKNKTPHKQGYTYFVYDKWGSQTTWASLVVDGCSLEPQARGYFWETYQEQILNELQQWQQKGYEIDGRIGPQSISVCLAEQIRVKTDIVDILLWIFTFGLAWLMHKLGNEERVYAVYRPVEFRLRMYLPSENLFPIVPEAVVSV